jgi:FixJ family two-component response regulator
MLDAVSTAVERDRKRREDGKGFAATRDRYESLTEREKQVTVLVASGLMNKQVAGKLSLSEVTVKIHRGSAMRKMQARTLADLIKMVEHIKPVEPKF